MEENTRTAAVPYETTSDYEWTDKAYKLLVDGRMTTEVRFPNSILSTHVQGPCPRCGHQIDDYQTHTAVTNIYGRSRPIPVPEWVKIDVTCSCEKKHEGRPMDQYGCGANFRVEVASGLEPTPTRRWWSRFTRR